MAGAGQCGGHQPGGRVGDRFSQEEDQELHNGKLGQELKAVRRNLEGLSKDGMILLNEPITGTSPMENLYISRIVLCSLKVKAIRGIWVTPYL